VPPEPEQSEEPQDAGEHDLDRPLDDVVLEAALAAIPPGLLAQLKAAGLSRSRAPSSGRAGLVQHGRLRGRPAGTRRGELRDGQRLNVVETLRAAAPWQSVRTGVRVTTATPACVQVRPEDFRIARFKQRAQTTTIFVVDASGSAALHRLAEAKGAVELLLADCYVRRDRVALIAFRGQGAEIVLPPTRSLVRAKRSLAGLPGGGGTPLATGIDMALELASSLARRGDTPVLIVLTDGRANVARDGSGSRTNAERDAIAAARSARLAGIAALLIDTSPRPEPQAERIAAEMGARYLPLPHADAQVVSRAARTAGGR
jgi:magnesium chelatase subunit D